MFRKTKMSFATVVLASRDAWRRRRILAFCLALPFLQAIAPTLDAQGLIANAQISAQPAGKGMFDYTITLFNSSASTSPVVTFWYAWSPGGPNYLYASPSSAQPPAGWAATIAGGGSPNDGYSIRFETLNSPIAPGASARFGFISLDSPASVNGNSVWYPGVPVGTSIAYSGHLSGAKDIFVVQPVPEPSTLSLTALGWLGLAALVWRKPKRAA